MSNYMSRATAKRIAQDAMAALQSVADDHGLTLTEKPGTLGLAGQLTFKVDFCQKSDEGVAVTKEFAALERIKPGVAGKTFYIAGIGYVTLTGYNSRAKKYTVNYTLEGKRFKAHEGFLNQCTPERLSE